LSNGGKKNNLLLEKGNYYFSDRAKEESPSLYGVVLHMLNAPSKKGRMGGLKDRKKDFCSKIRNPLGNVEWFFFSLLFLPKRL